MPLLNAEIPRKIRNTNQLIYCTTVWHSDIRNSIFKCKSWFLLHIIHFAKNVQICDFLLIEKLDSFFVMSNLSDQFVFHQSLMRLIHYMQNNSNNIIYPRVKMFFFHRSIVFYTDVTLFLKTCKTIWGLIFIHVMIISRGKHVDLCFKTGWLMCSTCFVNCFP